MAKSLTPVYLPKLIRDGEDSEMYEVSIAQNEEVLNQNLDYLYKRIQRLEGKDTTEDEK